MRQQQGSFRGFGDLELFWQTWLPDTKPRAVVAIVHGFGEHSGRYGNVVNYLVPRGFAVAAYDLRGHGRSQGPRGLILSWDEYRDDTRLFLESARQDSPGAPVFLYGLSLGGLIALDYVMHMPEGLRGVIASGPVLGPPGVSPFLLMLARVLTVVTPRLTLDSGLDATAISRDPAVVRAYQEDPLVHSQAAARLGGEMTRVAAWTQSHAADIAVPLLIIQGALDRLTSPADSLRFFENAGSKDKTRIEYPGGFHEPHNDIEHDRVMADVEAWLVQHL